MLGETTFIDVRDGDGLTTSNPGVAFEWISSKRPREQGFRSHEFAYLADLANTEPLPPDANAIAAAYQFYVVRIGEEVH